MNYPILPENLHNTADVVYDYLKNEIGLRKIQIESSIDDNIGYRPTFYAVNREFVLYCVDVSENIFNLTRSIFISDCEHNCRPVKFHIAIPSSTYTGFSSELKRAREGGIGIIEVNTQAKTCASLNSALTLSLCGLRKFNKSSFPLKYREVITNADSTFRNGEPNKACLMIYEEIESITRKIAYQAQKNGLFRVAVSNPRALLSSTAWARVLGHIRDDVNRGSGSRYSCLTDALISQIHGITPHRNQSGHKPNSVKKLIARDGQLRTRMESAVDLLLELVTASRSLRV